MSAKVEKSGNAVQVTKTYLDTYTDCINTVTTFYLLDVNGDVLRDVPRVQFMSHLGMCIDL